MNSKIIGRFYHTESGTSPVLEWLRSLPPDDRYENGQDPHVSSFAGPFTMLYLTGFGKFGPPLPSRCIAQLISALKMVNCLGCMALSRRSENARRFSELSVQTYERD